MEGDDELSPKTLAHQRIVIVIAIIIVKSYSHSLFVIFLFRDFHVNHCVCVGFSEISLTHLHNFGVWINFIGNYPQHLVLSLRLLSLHSQVLPIQYLSLKQPRATDMAPSRRKVTHAIAVVPNASKRKGKAIEAPEPVDHDQPIRRPYPQLRKLPLYLCHAAGGAGC